MFSLAVSLAIFQAATSRLDSASANLWNRVEPSVVVVLKGQSRRGTAALIDQQGYFITGRSVVAGNGPFEGQFDDGRRVTLFVVTTDGPTQLALLRTYDPMGDRRSVPLYRSRPSDVVDIDHPRALVAALPDGPAPAQLVSTRTLALVGNGHEVINLSEIHYEGPPGRVAGSPVFSLDGSLVGVLSASLSAHERPRGSGIPPGHPHSLAAAPMLNAREDETDSILYSPGPVVMQRVIAGFLTPQHAVVRPAIGVFCRDAPVSGALVDAVTDDSPADRAAIKEGDIILAIDGTPIRKAFDFGRTMLRQTVGSTIAVLVRRHERMLTFHVRVGM